MVCPDHLRLILDYADLTLVDQVIEVGGPVTMAQSLKAIAIDGGTCFMQHSYHFHFLRYEMS